MNDFEKFNHIPNYDYAYGWDNYALEYAQLLKPDTVYALTKDLIHAIVLDNVPSSGSFHVLDLNCGTGNDFPFFFEQNWTVTGCDGSKGMLNLASETYASQIQSGQLSLYHGHLEMLNNSSFGQQQFDLIFSVTGGYTYIDDDTFLNTNEVLAHYLKSGGWMITAHLNRFCLAETLYYLIHLNPRQALLRLKPNLTIGIRGEKFRMYLRGPQRLKRLRNDQLECMRIIPLLSITPPYQTGFNPDKKTLQRLYNLEMKWRNSRLLSLIADQVVTVFKKK